MFSLPEITRVSAIATRPSLTFIARQNVTARFSSRPIGLGCQKLDYEKCLRDRVADTVELCLEAVEKLVQPRGDDVIHRRVSQIRAQPPQPLLRLILKAPRLR